MSNALKDSLHHNTWATSLFIFHKNKPFLNFSHSGSLHNKRLVVCLIISNFTCSNILLVLHILEIDCPNLPYIGTVPSSSFSYISCRVSKFCLNNDARNSQTRIGKLRFTCGYFHETIIYLIPK